MDKQRFRLYCKQKQFGCKNRYIKNKTLATALQKRIESLQGSNFMLYIPMKHEVDVMPLIKWLRRAKKRVWVPCMTKKSFALVPFRLPLKRKKFGIMEPKQSYLFRKQKIDIAIVPVLGVDRCMRRIGFGKGMYDRFFEEKEGTIKKRIFVSLVACISNKAVGDAHDIDAQELLAWHK